MSKSKFPIAKTATIISLSFAINFGLILTFSFQPFMVNDFYPEYTTEQVGTKTGYINGSFYIGGVVGGLFWGWLADIWGRKPPMLLSIILSIVFTIMFGLSPTFICALLARFFWGITTGAGAVYKVYLAEILTDEQQPRGFLLFGVVAGLSTVTGPIVGGFLAQPAEKYSLFQNNFFCQFPYLLPVLVPVVLSIFPLIGTCLFITESTKKEIPECCSKLASADTEYSLLSDDNSGDELGTNGKSVSSRNKTKTAIKHFFKVQLRECILYFVCQTSAKDVKDYGCKSLWEAIKNLVRVLILDRSVAISLLLFFGFGVVDLSVYQIYILLMISDEKHGGLSMRDNEIGFSFLLAGLTEAAVLLIVYPYLVKCFGYRGLLAVGFLSFAGSTALMSWVSTIFSSVEYAIYNETTSTTVNESALYYCDKSAHHMMESFKISSISRLPIQIWLYILILLAVLTVCRTICRITTIVLINNSTLSETAGIVNGVSNSLRGLSGGVTQVAFGALFTWSQNNTTWPLNYHFTFILIAVFSICILPIIILLPASIEFKRKKS